MLLSGSWWARGEPGEKSMTRALQIALAAAFFVGGTSLATAQNGLPTGGYPAVAGGANGYPGPYYNYYAMPYAAGTYNYAAPYSAGAYYNYAAPYYLAPPGVDYSYGYTGPGWR
jgi:hypothetical protein